MNTATQPLSGLARRLVADEVLSAEEAQEALKQSSKQKIAFVTHLVENDIADSFAIANAASEEFGVPLFDIETIDFESIPKELVSEKLIRKHSALPLYLRGNRLFVAVSDPTNLGALDDIKFHTGSITDAVLVEEKKLSRAIESFLESEEDDTFDDLDDTDLEDLDVEAVSDDKKDDEPDGADEAPIVRFVNKMLLDAIKAGASDLHFEPYEKSYRIRFRTDGILKEMAKPPTNLATRLAARLKIMSSMDISERRIPQDGRIKMRISKNKAIDFRVNTLPTLFGEKVVLRILDPSSAQLGIDALGYEPAQKDLYMTALHQPQGLILVTGPTGSGKTVSLYTGLNILNTPERNIATAEDPVEINLEGINQVHVNHKVGLDFATALRSFLRQDPDVVMVGEIRDLETAEISIKASQTGHMVLSTLHTNSASETLTRMRNMGVPAFNLATSVSLIIAQRLARRLCPECKEIIEVPDSALEEEGFTSEQINGKIQVYQAVGCKHCSEGYKGRVGVYEVVKITPELSSIIMNDGNSLQLAEQAQKQGFNNLRQSGLKKVIEGVTSLEEVNRVTTG